MEVNQVIASDDEWGEAPEGVDTETWNSWKQWKMKPPDDFIFQVSRGMTGKNIGLQNGLTNVNKYIHGTHQARYYLIGADSGVGKTTISDFMFILKAWEDAKRQGRAIKIFYCSFEIGKIDKMAKWTAYYAFYKFGVRLPTDYILGRIEGKLLTPEHHRIVIASYAMVQEMMKDIKFVADILHPTKIFEDLIEAHYDARDKDGKPINGIVERTELTEEQKKKHNKGYVKSYKAFDPDMIIMLLVDTLNLTGSEQGLDTKHIMDRLSRYAIVLRNMFHTTSIFIQQFSTDMMSWHRSNKKNVDAIAPQRIDFGDSKATYRDADVVMGYAKPFVLDFEEWKGYILISGEPSDEIAALGNYFILQYVMKNRYGAAQKCIPLFLDPIAGIVYDLPLAPHNVLAMQVWYKKAKELDNTILEFS